VKRPAEFKLSGRDGEVLSRFQSR